MRAEEFLRGLLDIVDGKSNQRQEPSKENPIEVSEIVRTRPDLDEIAHSNDTEAIRRYQQIIDILPDESDSDKPYTNSPNPKVADIEAVTTQSGDDLNKSKNPSDIRSNSISMYPNFQAMNKE